MHFSLEYVFVSFGTERIITTQRQTRSDSQTAEADGRIVHLEQFDVSSDWLPVKMHQKAQPSEGDLQEQLHAPRSFHIHHLNSCSTRYRCT
jgi:hypothetical protein